MKSREELQTHLGEILDRLGPGLWLEIDGRYLKAVFGPKNPMEDAHEFAANRHCCFIKFDPCDSHDPVGKFSRAYSKGEGS